MPARALTGSRIRERRVVLGLKQTVLARTVGISAAYLNLIEHNKRRIGGKLLVDIALALDVDAAVLAEGAEADQVVALRDAAAQMPETPAEAARVEEFAGRFPGWAGLVSAQHRRINALERTVAALSDRMAHDPHLAASLHEVLSTVTSINATASILVETEQIEPEWRERFHRNIHEDSQRLADGTQALVGYLDMSDQREPGAGSPQEELEGWLHQRGHHIEELERSLPLLPETVLQRAEGLASPSARALAARFLQRYAHDAAAMPKAEFQQARTALGDDPAALAARFDTDLAGAMRRLASLPPTGAAGAVGLVVCDGSGTLTFRRQIDGFALPRFGAACPLWPLYRALSQPMVPVRALVEVAGRDRARFVTYAIAQPVGAPGFDQPPVFEATMLIIPADHAAAQQPAQPIGTSCRICPLADCAARREPSILAPQSEP